MTDVLEPREVADRTGLSLDTLRYSEREGLVGPIERRGAQRRYSDGDVAWIGLVTCLRGAGLGIADLREFTAMLRDGGSAEGAGRQAFLRGKLAQLLERRRSLDTAIGVLEERIAFYAGA